MYGYFATHEDWSLMRPITAKTLDRADSLPEEKAPPLPEAAALCVTTTMLLLFGLVVLYSTSFGIAGSSYFIKQIAWAAVSLFSFATVIIIGYKRLSDWSIYLMIGVAVLLMIADFLFPEVKGAHRWIKIPGIGNMQPSEYAKVILVLFMAKFCADRTRAIETEPFKNVFMWACILAGPVIGLVLLGKDLGTTLLLIMVFFLMLYAAGLKIRYLLPWPLIGLPALFFIIKEFSPVRWSRLTTFQNPELSQAGEGYQLWLSQLALGSGNWFGVGFTESILKRKYLPEAHTDFILSIVGEELGFVWICVVIVAYIVFVMLAIGISVKARTRQGMLLAFGMASFIGLQAIINLGVISGAFPTKGMPAPFISYGGSNLLTCLTATGLVLSVALDAAYPDYHLRIPGAAMDSLRRAKAYIKSII